MGRRLRLARLAPSRARSIELIAALAAALLLALFCRPLATDLGLRSFGRLWQYFVSYEELGFTRRAALGTILSLTRLNQLSANAYHFAFAFYAANLAVLFYLLYSQLRERSASPLFWCVVLFSPAILFHFAYSTGNLDLFLLTYALAIVSVRRSNILRATLIAIGVLFHETFLALVPFVLLILWSNGKVSARWVSSVLVAVFITLAAVHAFGVPDISQSDYQNYLERMPTGVSDRPGYFELTGSVEENRRQVDLLKRELSVNWHYLLLPAAYWVLVAAMLTVTLLRSPNVRHARPPQSVLTTGLMCVVLAPLALTFLATDVLRWACMSIQVAVLSVLYIDGLDDRSIPTGLLLVLLLFSVLGPIGSADFTRTFPAWSFALGH